MMEESASDHMTPSDTSSPVETTKTFMSYPSASSDYDIFTPPQMSVDDSEAKMSLASDGSVTPDSALMGSFTIDDYDLCLDARDMIVKVDNPEKHSSRLESYITFRITTRTTRSDFDAHEYTVRRRYNDFIWLRERLEEDHPSCIIPPLPEKHSLQRLQRFKKEFLKSRMIALNRFLSRVVSHPKLSYNEHLKMFLTAINWEFSTHRKQGVGFMGKMSEALQNITAPYLAKSPHPEFERIAVYAQTVGDKIACLERIAQRLQREELEYISELKELYPAFILWSSSETSLSNGIMAIAGAVDKCSSAQKEVTDVYESRLGQPLHEHVLYVDAVKEALRRRLAIQLEYELTVDVLNKRKLEKEQLAEALASSTQSSYSISSFLGKSKEENKQEKEARLEKAIEELIKQAEENNNRMQTANAEIKSEIDSWKQMKREDMKQIFMGMADRQIQYYKKCMSAWEESLTYLDSIEYLEGEKTDASFI